MNFNLTNEEMSALLHKAILDSLGEDGKQKIVEMAVKHLTTAERGTYGVTQPSPLQRVFMEAAERVARNMFDEEIAKSPEWQERVRALLTESVDTALTGDLREKIRDSVAKAISSAFYS